MPRVAQCSGCSRKSEAGLPYSHIYALRVLSLTLRGYVDAPHSRPRSSFCLCMVESDLHRASLCTRLCSALLCTALYPLPLLHASREKIHVYCRIQRLCQRFRSNFGLPSARTRTASRLQTRICMESPTLQLSPHCHCLDQTLWIKTEPKT